MFRIDHITLGAADLEQGLDEVRASLGIEIPLGGKHDLMATHNRLMRLGDGCFFEVIAVDPAAPPPGRPRWFSLDEPALRSKLEKRPRPVGWIVSATDLDAVAARSPVYLGELLTMKRGDRSWRLTVPADGSRPWDGLLPGFIEWSPGPHPSIGMQDLGARLRSVRLTHPQPEALVEVLRALGIEDLAVVEYGETGLHFEMAAPSGNPVTFSG